MERGKEGEREREGGRDRVEGEGERGRRDRGAYIVTTGDKVKMFSTL